MTRKDIFLTLALSFTIPINLTLSYSCVPLVGAVGRSAYKSKIRAECSELGGYLTEESTSEWEKDTCIKTDEEGNVQVLFKPVPKPTPAPVIK